MTQQCSARHSILIVEDEPIVAKDLQMTLRDAGFDAFAIAYSGEDAIKRASERCPDLVLMDIRIRGELDGIRTAEILRQRFGVAVVYLTAHADDATIERASATEPYGYLLKPIKAEELRTAVDIAVRRSRLDRGVRQRERWLATALRSVQDAVITTDANGRILYMNPAAEALTGTRADDALGHDSGELLRSLDREFVVSQTTPLGFDGVPTGEQPRGSVIVLHEIGERQKLQRQLEHADRLSSLGAMAASTAHELNNPLTVVMTNAGIIGEMAAQLRQSLSDPTAAASTSRVARIDEAVGDLQAAASRMARIVGDLRAFSRPQDNAPARIDLRHCIEWAVRATAHEYQLRAHIHTRFEPAPVVIGEQARIEQVLINLLVNAAHAIAPGDMDANEVLISLRTSEDGRAVIEIRDSGAGMAPEVLERIFDPFFTTKRAGVGTGLGLAICQGIVKALGGEIRVASTLGKGTSFTVLLNAAPPENLPEREAHADDLPALVPGRLLLIDDEVTLLRAMQRILEDEGHQVVACQSATQALAQMDTDAGFDLIISDLMMPTMTGIEFYAALKTRHPALVARVVFVTGGAITSQAAHFLDSIPNQKLEKPFKAAQLCAVVRQMLSNNPPAPANLKRPQHLN
jgi:signal transduction histidine kinase